MRRGISLLELVVVLALAGVLAGFALPAARRFYDAVVVERAAQTVVAAHRVARFSAIMRNCRTLLTVRPDSIAVRALNGGDTLNLWFHEGPLASAITLSAPSRAFGFAPNGLPIGVANATFELRRGATVRRVIVSRLGRTRIERR
jgi:prepilin-type N-terminal cleavage/methylation domain-containing protein